MMKKIVFLLIGILLCVAMSITAVGCNPETEEQSNDNNNSDTVEPQVPITQTTAQTSSPYVYACYAEYNCMAIDLNRNKSSYRMYQIDIAKDAEFNDIVSSNIYDFDYIVVTDLTADTQYYVRTRGFDGTNYSPFSATYEVKTSTKKEQEIVIDAEQLDLFIGDTYKVNAEVLPADASDTSVTWISTNEDVATVSADGLVTAVGSGNAGIIANSQSGKGAACAVHVSTAIVTKDTEKLVLDKSTLNGNAIFGRYYGAGNRSVETGVDFDGRYELTSFEVGNSLIYNSYFFGGIYKDVNVQGVPFSYTWTADSDFDFDGNDSIIVSDEHEEQTLGFVGAGAYDKVYLLSMADGYSWDSIYSMWELNTEDIFANVTVTYKDGTSETTMINFLNMMKQVDGVPAYDAYIPHTIVPQIYSRCGAEGTAPYMYAIAVDCDGAKQIKSVTLKTLNNNDDRKVCIAVFAAAGEIASAAPDALDANGAEISNLTSYGFSLSWQSVSGASGYYISIFNDEACTSVCYTKVFSNKIYMEQAVVNITNCGFENKYYNPGKTYYVKIAPYNASGSGKAIVIPITTVATYPAEIHLSESELSLDIGESATLTVKLPTTSYYTYSEIAWQVSDSNIIRVDGGRVTAVGAGEATVRAYLAQKPEIYRECTVTVASYEEGWIGYDNGVLSSTDTAYSVGYSHVAQINYGVLKITSADVGDGQIDSFKYYVSDDEQTTYQIYVLDEGQTPMGKTCTESGTIDTSSKGWTTVNLKSKIAVPAGKEVWIAIGGMYISRSEGYNPSASICKAEYHWTTFDYVNDSGIMMLRAHISK